MSLDRWLCTKLLGALGNPPLQVELWNGEILRFGDGAPAARIVFRDRGSLWRLAADPQLAFGDLYSDGRIEMVGDLVAGLEAGYLAIAENGRQPVTERLMTVLRWRPWPNSMRRARRNIHHHYDIGNAFYAAWLDTEAMQYTCAYYPREGMTLEQAQQAKMHHVCRKLRLRPGERVVEAGCGWGGLALFMAREYGVKVQAYNISQSQIEYARECCVRQGLTGRVEFVEDDYRNIRGEFDAFVSVGMLEHVGRAFYREFGGVIDRCLASDGRGLLHSIGRNRPGRLNKWIEKRLFPGAYPPTLNEMMCVLEPREFSVLDVENLRLHYGRTLDHWLERYESNIEQVRERFGRRFARIWRLYLAGSSAAFRSGWMQLFQIVFARPRMNDLPRSRAHLYGDR